MELNLRKQSTDDPFMLDCMICAEQAATLISIEGIFHCADCKTVRKVDLDAYCISCGVDSRMKGKQVCKWCHEADTEDSGYYQPTYSGLWGGNDDWEWESQTPVEDDLEMIKAAR